VVDHSHRRAWARWLRSEDELLIASFQSGQSEAEIAQQLGRTEGAILARLGKIFLKPNGLPSPRFPNPPGTVSIAESGRIIKAFLQGTPAEDLADEVGINPFGIAYHLLEARILEPISLDELNYPRSAKRSDSGLTTPREAWAPESDAALLKLWENNSSLETMVEGLQKARWSVVQRLYKIGKITDRDLEELLSNSRGREFRSDSLNLGQRGSEPEPTAPIQKESHPREPAEVPLPLPGDPISSRKSGKRENYRTGEEANLRAIARKGRFW
jgi:hypothetical protein